MQTPLTSEQEIEYLENLLIEVDDLVYGDLIINYIETKIEWLREQQNQNNFYSSLNNFGDDDDI